MSFAMASRIASEKLLRIRRRKKDLTVSCRDGFAELHFGPLTSREIRRKCSANFTVDSTPSPRIKSCSVQAYAGNSWHYKSIWILHVKMLATKFVPERSAFDTAFRAGFQAASNANWLLKAPAIAQAQVTFLFVLHCIFPPRTNLEHRLGGRRVFIVNSTVRRW